MGFGKGEQAVVQPVYMTVQEYAEVVRLTCQHVTWQCRKGRIPGAVQPTGSSRWLIPRAALPPAAREPDRGETAAARRKRAAANLAWLDTVK